MSSLMPYGERSTKSALSNRNKMQATRVILNFLVTALKSKKKGKIDLNNMFLTQYIQNLTNIKILRNFTFFFILGLGF